MPNYQSNTAAQSARQAARRAARFRGGTSRGETRGKVAAIRHLLRESQRAADRPRSCRVFEHNGIEVAAGGTGKLLRNAQARVGDMQAVADLKAKNVPQLMAMIERGYESWLRFPRAC